MNHALPRRTVLATLAALGFGGLSHAQQAQQAQQAQPAGQASQAGPTASGYPDHSIELVVPYAAGGGTDALARSFAEVSHKYMKQSIVVNDRPGASGAIGYGDVIASKADGYKMALLTVEITFLNSLGIARFTHEAFTPIARLNFDPSAVTVRADAPWNTIEEFLDAARKNPGEIKMGNAGNGSIWNLTASALEDQAHVKFNQVPFQGAAPAVLSLLGGHIDAVAVSPAEVSVHLGTGNKKLKMLAVMSAQRLPAFDTIPTLKERGVDVALGAWRGLAVAKGTPPEIVDYLKGVAEKTAKDPAFIDSLQKLNLGYSYADASTFKAQMVSDSAFFKSLIDKIGMKLQ